MMRLPERLTAPRQFLRAPATVEAGRFWRDLKYTFVPETGGVGGSVIGGLREIITGTSPSSNGLTPTAERAGLAASTATSQGVNFTQLAAPASAPFSVFAYVVRRDTSSNIQSLFGNGAAAAGGWTFQLNYGGGQIGVTRWGIADHASTTLGPVPSPTDYRGGCAVAITYDGSTFRMMRDDRFENVSAGGGVSAPSSPNVSVGRDANSNNPLVNTSIHVIYCWTRVVDDVELQRLVADPWLPIRPRRRRVVAIAAGGGGGGGGARVFIPAIIG